MNNNKVNPLQALEAKVQANWTGCLEIAEPIDSNLCWHIYLTAGKVQYATTNILQTERCNYFWHKFQPNLDCLQLNDIDTEYEQLHNYLSQQKVAADDIKILLVQLIKDALNQLLSIEQTTVKDITTKVITSTEIDCSWRELYDQKTVERYRKVRQYIAYFSCQLSLAQADSLKFYKLWKKLNHDPQFETFVNSYKIADFVTPLIAQASIYKLALINDISSLELAEYLRPFIEEKIITIIPSKTAPKTAIKMPKINQQPQENEINRLNSKNPQDSLLTNKVADEKETIKPLVACIDDSKTVQTQVKMTLEAVGYQVINVNEAGNALKRLSHTNPALILMDINMPTINGYDLCAMLRRSYKFKEIPIVMLTGRDGIIDRMRAKIVGSTDYLTKPFEPEKLISIVAKFTQ